MKKIVSVILMICMMVGTGGYQLINHLYRIRIKSEMKAYLHNNPQSKYTNVFHFIANDKVIEEPNFEWEQKGKEFSYQGGMYDVVKIEYSVNRAIVYCVNDKAEASIKRALSDMYQQQNSPIANTRMNIHKIFSAMYDFIATHVSVVFAQHLIHSAAENQYALIKKVKEILKPPPEMSFV